ncbi:MAG: DUF4145 domain-containing protein [Bacteroidetes bacterium]|nr:DUF4145 domain-containing protein [Bacteroidota bacterium]
MEKVTSTEHKMTESTYKCGHCGIDARMFIVCEGEHTITDNDSDGDVWFKDLYQLLLCPSCNSINAIKTSYDHETAPIDWEGNYDDVVVEYLFPSIKSGNFKNLPSRVEKSYAEAIKLKKLEPRASVVSSRKLLEAICDDKKASENDRENIQVKINNLAEKEKFPTLLRDAAHSIRLLGNKGAHEPDAEVSVDDAETLLALCDAIIVYVYEAPQLVQRIQERLKNSKREA